MSAMSFNAPQDLAASTSSPPKSFTDHSLLKRPWHEDYDSAEENQKYGEVVTTMQSPKNKRVRYDDAQDSDLIDDVDTKLVSQELAMLPREPERDATYYFLDGSCVLLVDDTLFNSTMKVHRTILSKDGSSFRDMFTLPQTHTTHSLPSDGTSDAHPLVLTGDTPAQFRNFLWALYALPHELMVVHTPRADLGQLIDIAEISLKYAFKNLETWSLDAIQEYINRKPSPLLTVIPAASYTFSSFSSSSLGSLSISDSTAPAVKPHSKEAQECTARLTQLIRLSQLCGHERLLATMISTLRQLMSLNIHYAYLAMTLADDLDLRTLRGPAYLEVMSKTTVVPGYMELAEIGVGKKKDIVGAEAADPAVDKEDEEDDCPMLTPSQRLRLLSGYYRLTHTWDHLRTHPPSFEHAPSCGATWHQPGCTQSWVEFWKEKTRGEGVVGLGLADVLGRLRGVQKEFDRWGSATYMHHDCRMSARRGLAECVRRIEESLPSYFE